MPYTRAHPKRGLIVATPVSHILSEQSSQDRVRRMSKRSCNAEMQTSTDYEGIVTDHSWGERGSYCIAATDLRKY